MLIHVHVMYLIIYCIVLFIVYIFMRARPHDVLHLTGIYIVNTESHIGSIRLLHG